MVHHFTVEFVPVKVAKVLFLSSCLFVGYSTSGPEISHTKIKIIEKPKNNDAPKFITSFYSTSILEEWYSSTEPIMTVKAEFWYSESLRYSIEEKGKFKVDEISGELFLTNSIDREETPRVTINILVIVVK
jgi:hypothetical protein